MQKTNLNFNEYKGRPIILDKKNYVGTYRFGAVAKAIGHSKLNE